jgi:hypothetical protein
VTLIDKTFAHHKPSPEGLATITFLQEEFSAMKAVIEANMPASRERFIALTKLEELAMWAVKAVVCNDPKSEVQ